MCSLKSNLFVSNEELKFLLLVVIFLHLECLSKLMVVSHRLHNNEFFFITLIS